MGKLIMSRDEKLEGARLHREDVVVLKYEWKFFGTPLFKR